MYLFIAHYTSFKKGNLTRQIEVEEQSFDNEKDCYLYAMSEAYDLMEDGEMLDSVEFISC